MKTAKLQQKRRLELTRMVRSLTIVCTVWFASGVDSTGAAHEPSCGCESSPACDGGCAHQTYRKKPKSLSFAEKILKHFDHVGDKIEAEHRPRSAARSFAGHRAEPQCGVEMGPTCGCEAAPSGCNCHACTSQPMQGYSQAYPEQPFTYTNVAPHMVGESIPATPMHPDTPIEKQAIGKISDKPSSRSSPLAAPSSTIPPTTSPQLPVKKSEPFYAPKLNPSESSVKKIAPAEKPESTAEPFTPRFPKATSDAPSLRNIPADSNSTGYPAKRPAAEIPTAPSPSANLPSTGFPPAGLPPAGLPSSTNGQVPDVLVDPFQDDVTWQSKRNQMNGIKLTAGPGRTKMPVAPVKESEAVQLKSVPKEELEQPLPIILTPARPIESGNVIQSSFHEAFPVITNQVPKAKVIHFNNPEDYVPTVKRKAVPTPK